MDINNASRKFATGINTTNGKFATSFNYTCHKITNSDNNTNIPKISLSPSKNKFTNSALILFNLVVVWNLVTLPLKNTEKRLFRKISMRPFFILNHLPCPTRSCPASHDCSIKYKLNEFGLELWSKFNFQLALRSCRHNTAVWYKLKIKIRFHSSWHLLRFWMHTLLHTSWSYTEHCIIFNLSRPMVRASFSALFS